MKSQVVSLLSCYSALTLAQYTPKVPIDTRPLDMIYAAAKKEHAPGNSSYPLQVFFGGDAGSQGDSYRTAWAQQFPDIPLNLTIALSKYHDVRLDQAYSEGRHLADVVALQTLQDFPRWKTANRLMYYKPATFEDVLSQERDPDGAFLPFAILGFGGITYDKTKCSEDEVPSTFESLADPEWKDKLILTYPNDDDAVAYLFSLIVSHYGVSWLKKLATNNVQWVRGTGTPGFELVRQHNDTSSKRCLTFTSFSDSASYLVSKTVEAPENIMAWPQTVAILAGTPQPETAKLFISWLTSYERQSMTSRTSALESVNDANGVNPYASNTTIFSGFKVFEQNRATVEWWKNVFEDILGTPQGVDPLQVYPNPPCCA